MKKIFLAIFVVFAGWLAFLLLYKNPKNAHLVIAGKYVMQDVPAAMKAVDKRNAPFLDIDAVAENIPGQDDVVFFPEQEKAFVTAMDGYFWKLDLKTKQAERFVKTPLIPPGARRNPVLRNKILFCASRLHGRTFPDSEKVGVYELDTDTKAIQPVLQRVFTPQPAALKNENPGIVYGPGKGPELQLAAMNAGNSIDMPFCNDLDVSADGERIYFTAPYSYAGASMAGGTFGEAITLARNGYLWMFDRRRQVLSLVARDFNFIDGILVEGRAGQREESVLITETTKFKIDRLYVSGPKAGTHEILWENLPGMPDGMDRDSEGRIWVGLIKKRSGLISWAHRNPWIKNLFLNLPRWLLPVPKQTGILCLSADGARPLYYAMHEGKVIQDISVAVPYRDRLYLPNFSEHTHGLFSLPFPKDLGK